MAIIVNSVDYPLRPSLCTFMQSCI